MEKINYIDDLIEKPMIKQFLKLLFTPNSYVNTLVVVFSSNWKLSEEKFVKFLQWLYQNSIDWWLFTDERQLEIEIIPYMEKMAVEEWVDLSNLTLRKKILNEIYLYLYWNVVDFLSMKELCKLLNV